MKCGKRSATEQPSAPAQTQGGEGIFEGAFAHAPEATFLADEDGCIVAWNRAAESLFGLPAQAVLGKHITDLQALLVAPGQEPALPLERAWAEYRSAIQGGEKTWASRRKEGKIDRPEGMTAYLEQTIFPIPYGGGYRLAVVYRDITEQHCAEQREQRRHALLENVIQLGKAVSRVTNLQQCYQEIYQCIQQGLGFDRVGLFAYDAASQEVRGIVGTERTGEMGDKSWLVQTVHPGDTWTQILTSPKGFHIVDNSQTTADEGDNMVGVKENVVLAAWAGETPVGFIAVDNLITERHITPEQIEALQLFAGYVGLAIQNARWNEELEKHVTERTVALELANRELESLSYTIAHDLRSPLRAVVGFSKILQETYPTSSDADRLSLYHKVHREGLRMGRMVDDFLHFLQLGRTPLKKRFVDMTALAARVVQILQEEHLERAVQFTVGQLPACEADPGLMYVVFDELLSNAIQFTTTREQAQVEIGAISQEHEIHYFVRDNGIGFNMDHAGKLFGVFQQLHPPSIEDTNTGIGLANARRIITRHGGRIWAEAEEGRGATFYFTVG